VDKRKKMPMIASVNHFHIKQLLTNNEVKTVVDVGGTGRLYGFSIVNANLKRGIDGTNLPYSDNSFDAAVSNAVLEHVNDIEKFITESIRVSTKISIHWFPYDIAGRDTEILKKKLKHNHKCVVPMESDFHFLNDMNVKYSFTPFITIYEHLLSLAMINRITMNDDVINFILNHIGEYYGTILEIKKL
jgi:hypothetical protein